MSRYGGKLCHIGMGRGHAGEAVTMLICDRDVWVVSFDGELLRHLEIDPTKDYQSSAQEC